MLRSVQWIAADTGFHVATVRRWIYDAKLPSIKLPGGHLRVRDRDYRAFLATYQQNGEILGETPGDHPDDDTDRHPLPASA
jgi:predicted site-specific integrase-resolvase